MKLVCCFFPVLLKDVLQSSCVLKQLGCERPEWRQKAKERVSYRAIRQHSKRNLHGWKQKNTKKSSKSAPTVEKASETSSGIQSSACQRGGARWKARFAVLPSLGYWQTGRIPKVPLPAVGGYVPRYHSHSRVTPTGKLRLFCGCTLSPSNPEVRT